MQTNLFDPDPGQPIKTEGATMDHHRIILMDLNVALSDNFHLMRHYHFTDFIKRVETYREHMVDMLRDEYVILITARKLRWARLTLERIKQTTGWLPQEAVFNDTGISGSDAPAVKRTLLNTRVFPEHPDVHLSRYLAIESNRDTREMYAEVGIRAVDCDRRNAWVALPT